LNAEPYKDLLVTKKECVGHVEKRMGTRLRNVKKNNKGMGGKGAGKLTDKLINELTKFYGLAIRRHSDSVEEMRKEIWATFINLRATKIHSTKIARKAQRVDANGSRQQLTEN